MALTGVHIACGFAGNNENPSLSYPVMGQVFWSQTMATAGTAAQSASPSGETGRSSIMFEIDCAADVYVAIGQKPDPVNGPRRFFAAADGKAHWYCQPGDRLAWVLA